MRVIKLWNSRVISVIDQRLNPSQPPDSQNLQQANNTCTKLTYTVLSLSQHVVIELNPVDSPCSVFGDTNTSLSVSVHLLQNCPPGVSISKSENSCVCEPRLAHYTNSCTITNSIRRITRKLGQLFWIGYPMMCTAYHKRLIRVKWQGVITPIGAIVSRSQTPCESLATRDYRRNTLGCVMTA